VDNNITGKEEQRKTDFNILLYTKKNSNINSADKTFPTKATSFKT
jgi:hypothetical protein